MIAHFFSGSQGRGRPWGGTPRWWMRAPGDRKVKGHSLVGSSCPWMERGHERLVNSIQRGLCSLPGRLSFSWCRRWAHSHFSGREASLRIATPQRGVHRAPLTHVAYQILHHDSLTGDSAHGGGGGENFKSLNFFPLHHF